MWPLTRKKKAPEQETRAAFPSVTAEYLSHRQTTLTSDGRAALSATVATCAGFWSRGFAMMDPAPDPGPLTADVLAAIGLDLCLRGESCWHVRVEGNNLALHRVAYWDHVARGRFHLHLARPNETETVRALADEVMLLTINSAAETPWVGRSPLVMAGGSPSLVAEIEAAVSRSTEWLGKGVLPMPDTIDETNQSQILRGLKSGGTLAAVKSKADFSVNTGQTRGQEFHRVELGPDLQKADLNPFTDALHNRILAAAGIPPALVTDSSAAGGMREAYRLLVLQTLEPVARMLAPEFAKVGVTGMSSASMMASDTAGRARSVGALVKAGVELERAMELVGWGNDSNS